MLSRPWQELDNLRAAAAAHAVGLSEGTQTPRARLFELTLTHKETGVKDDSDDDFALSSRLLTALGDIVNQPQQRLRWETLLRELLPANATTWRRDHHEAAAARAWRREHQFAFDLQDPPQLCKQVGASQTDNHEEGLPRVRSTVALSSHTPFAVLATEKGGERGGVGVFARSTQSGRHFFM